MGGRLRGRPRVGLGERPRGRLRAGLRGRLRCSPRHEGSSEGFSEGFAHVAATARARARACGRAALHARSVRRQLKIFLLKIFLQSCSPGGRLRVGLRGRLRCRLRVCLG